MQFTPETESSPISSVSTLRVGLQWLAVLALASTTRALGGVGHFDGTFAGTDWVLSVLTSGNGGSTPTSQETTGGNPGAFRRMVMTVQAAPDSTTRSAVIGFHRNAIYSPASQGAVAWIDYSEDGLLLSGAGEGQRSGPGIRQGDKVFVLGAHLSTSETTWTSKQRRNLVASDFVWASMGQPDPLDHSVHPDFSAAGAPMELGYFRSLVTPLGGASATVDAGIDNWSFVVVASAGRAYCFGSAPSAACPCGNFGAPGNGCANSIQANGANLAASGQAVIGADHVRLVATGMPDGAALYFQGTTETNGGLGLPFGDGLRCTGGVNVRLALGNSVGGMSQYPEPGNASLSVAGAVPALGGTRTYQVWYRNPAVFCTPATFNLTNALSITWVPCSAPVEITLPDADGEDFANAANLDAARSGASWGSGRLTRGHGGGRGRLGELKVPSGSVVTLDTDSTTFPLNAAGIHDVMTNLVPGVDYDPSSPLTQPSIQVTDGIFEFSKLLIEPNGTLVIRGTRPARIFSRGDTGIHGLIDVSGSTPLPHPSNSTLGGPGGAGGPNAGKGGDGATRFDSGGTNLVFVGGVDVPDLQLRVDGLRGDGVGRFDFIGAGFGGQHFPAATPTSTNLTPPGNGDLRFSNIGGSCLSAQVSQTGGGGGYATDGRPGVPATSPLTNLNGTSNLPVPGSSGGGGPASELGLEPPGSPPVVRKLAADPGYLRGGSGGGGGGAHLFATESAGLFPACDGPGFTISLYRDHSGAGGGGGGGAIQVATGGSNFSLSGLIDAGGGDGGSAPIVLPGETSQNALRSKRTSPGGGGSGGAIRLQAVSMPDGAFAPAAPPRLAIDGGAGGANSLNGRGGAGGAGLLRLEGLLMSPTAAAIAPLILPTDPTVVGTNAINVLSIGAWEPPRHRPETYSGAVSCWMRPACSFTQLEFKVDNPGAPNPVDRLGWDMDVLWGTSGAVYSYRDANNSPFPGQSIEAHFGNLFEEVGVTGSYVVVRFQGARSAVLLHDPCDVDLATAVVPGSVTPWVSHPKDLNLFTPRPDMVRFTVVFDASRGAPGMPESIIEGVTRLKIRANAQ